MKNIIQIVILITIITTLAINCNSQNDRSIVLIVDSFIINEISNELNTFILDLNKENYNVILKNSTFISPEEVREYLQNLYNQTKPQLVGAILIGYIPLARQYFISKYTNPSIPPTIHNCYSTQFYSDLDGEFLITNSEYPNSYSSHTGNVESEIWVSILPYYYDDIKTVMKIKQYFKKNHNYRNFGINFDEGFLEINELYHANNKENFDFYINSMLSGDYSWSPFTEWGNVGLFIKNSIGNNDVNYAYKHELITYKYRFAVLSAHGNYLSNGNLRIDDLKSMSIKPPFIILGGCNTANFDYPKNFTTELVYSEINSTLIALGNSSFSGGLGSNINGFYGKNIAKAMLEGKSLGEAYLIHNNSPLLFPWSSSFESHNAVPIFIGDLSLTLFPVPQVVMLVSPIDQTLINDSLSHFAWSASKGSKAYHIQISSDFDFENILINENVMDTIFRVEELFDYTNYFWRVRGINPSYSGKWSNISEFKYDITSNTSTKSDDTFFIFHNPIYNTLRIKNIDNEAYRIKIINISGLILFETKAHGETEVNLSNFKSGVYFLNINSSKFKTTKKVIIRYR